MNKSLFSRLWLVLTSPQKAWKVISDEGTDDKNYLSSYFYPLIGLTSLTAFISPFIFNDATFKDNLTTGMMSFAVAFSSVFFGYYASARVLERIYIKVFNIDQGLSKVEILTAYSLSPVLAVSIITRLVSEFFFLKIIFLYIFILIWESTTHFYNVDEKKQGLFTAISGLVILILPEVIEFILKLVLPGLK